MEQTQEATPPISLINHALKFGLILGAISIVCVILVYVVSIPAMATFKFILLLLAIGLGFVIYAGINYRTEIGGFIPYGKAYLHGLVVFVVSAAMGVLFGIVLYHVIDPDLPEKLVEAIIQNTEEMMRNFGANDEGIDTAIEKMKTDLPDQFSAGGQVLGFFKQLIWYAVLSLLTALFVKKNEPMEM